MAGEGNSENRVHDRYVVALTPFDASNRVPLPCTRLLIIALNLLCLTRTSTERHKMAHDQYALLVHDMDELRKRYDQLCDKYTHADVECSRALDEAVSLECKV